MARMRVFELDAGRCATVRSFCSELKTVIGAIEGVHGNSVPAFIDSMIFGAMGDLAPPYTIRVTGLKRGPVRDFARDLSFALGQARIDLSKRGKPDVEVVLQLVG